MVPVSPDVIAYVCRNCTAESRSVPRQWNQDGLHVVVQEIPCSGKIDGQYIFHALEVGVQGLCVVACPKGQCTLAEGNYRAEVRIRTVQRLLTEIGIESDRAELLHCSPDDPPQRIEELIRGAVQRFPMNDAPSAEATISSVSF